jgi:hypothetical protein
MSSNAVRTPAGVSGNSPLDGKSEAKTASAAAVWISWRTGLWQTESMARSHRWDARIVGYFAPAVGSARHIGGAFTLR